MEYAYATCILNESGEEINEKNLTAVLEAAGCEVQESRVKALVAALEDIEIDSAVDFEDLGSDPAHNGAPTTGDPSEPAEADLKDASGMDLVPEESSDEFDDSGATNGAVDAEADGTAEAPDESGATSGAVDAEAGGTTEDSDDDSGGLDGLFGEEASGSAGAPDGTDGSSEAAVDWDAATASEGADTETASESDEV